MNDIIQFPKDKIIREYPHHIEELERAKEKGINNFCEQLTSEIAELMLEIFENSGLDTEDAQFGKDFTLTVDLIRATVCRSMGVKHQLHQFIDEHVSLVPQSELDQGEETDDEPGNSGC